MTLGTIWNTQMQNPIAFYEPLEVGHEADLMNTKSMVGAGLPSRESLPIRPSIPGCSTFSLALSTTSKPRLSRFNETRRKQVARLRCLGSCSNCRKRKIMVG